MNVLVTGGAGYVGSHAAKALARTGARVVVLDDLSQGHREAVRWGPLVEASLVDQGTLRSVLERERIDAVAHFAASTSVRESMRSPEAFFRNNVINSLHLLEAMQVAGVTRIVFSSSCAVYGDARVTPIAEEAALAPVNPYGDSKLFVERALAAYGRAHGFSWVALRYFNAAGADSEGEIGEHHSPETHLIPLAIAAALPGGRELPVYGTDYPTPDGTAVRDYVHVTDLAEGHVAALDYLARGGMNAAFNLGAGAGHSVRDVVGMVGRVAGAPVPVRECPRREGDVPVLVADASKARVILGWNPAHSSLENMVRTAWGYAAARRS